MRPVISQEEPLVWIDADLPVTRSTAKVISLERSGIPTFAG